MSLTKWIIAFTLAILLACLVASCNGEGEKKDGKTAGKIYYFPTTVPITNLDPAHVNNPNEDSVAGEIFDGLVHLDESFKVAPEIAESWEYDPETATYIFHIRKDIRFHNGKSVTADDVKYSFERILDPRIDSEHADWALHIKGSSAFHTGRTAHVQGLKVIDDYTIQIELASVFTPFLKLLTTSTFSIMPNEEITTSSEDNAGSFIPIGTGPFKFDKIDEDGSIVLSANPDYYMGKPNLDGIVFKFIDNPKTMLNEYRKGRLHHIPIVPEISEDIIKDESIQGDIDIYPVNEVFYFAFNLDKNQFGGAQDKELKRLIRQALNYAVSRDEICKDILKDRAIPGEYVIPKGMLGYENALADVLGFKHDKEKCQELLAESNHANGKGISKVSIHALSDSESMLVADAIRMNFIEEGLDAEVVSESPDEHDELISKQKAAFFSHEWRMEYPDIDNFLSLFDPGNARGGVNVANLTRDYIGVLIEKTRETDNPEELNQLYRELEKELWFDAPWLFMFQRKNAILVRPEVKGLINQICQLDYSEAISHVRMELVDLVPSEEKKEK